MKSADGLLLVAVREAVSELDLKPQDIGTVRLAEKYAEAIDLGDLGEDGGADVLEKLGPKLLAALESLGASPAARAKVTGKAGDGSSSGPGRLHALRDAHRTA